MPDPDEFTCILTTIHISQWAVKKYFASGCLFNMAARDQEFQERTLSSYKHIFCSDILKWVCLEVKFGHFGIYISDACFENYYLCHMLFITVNNRRNLDQTSKSYDHAHLTLPLHFILPLCLSYTTSQAIAKWKIHIMYSQVESPAASISFFDVAVAVSCSMLESGGNCWPYVVLTTSLSVLELVWYQLQSQLLFCIWLLLCRGKVAFVTGGGSGIGFTIAEVFMRWVWLVNIRLRWSPCIYLFI